VCGRTRSYAWQTEGHPNEGAVPLRQLGDARPSEIISASAFAAELERLAPLAGADPTTLDPAEWRASLAATERSLTCLYELLKHEPPDRATREAELERLLARRKRYGDDAPRIWALEAQGHTETVARGAIDRDALRAHEAWVRAGRSGPGRLDVVGFDARGARLAGVLFEGARLERVVFDGALLEAARMIDAELVDVSARAARATSLALGRATLARGTFAGATLALATFVEARIDGTSFERADLDRTDWRGAVVTGASFADTVLGNAWLDGGTFRACTFERADLRPRVSGLRATRTDALFEDCDLRGASWDGRDISRARFVRCRT
jgi:uncharacterized protein YjbI with pentapeptide repeats